MNLPFEAGVIGSNSQAFYASFLQKVCELVGRLSPAGGGWGVEFKIK
ncbi:MAG: hypothetical protein AAF573_06780 [Bacteroidota bacterium]